MKGSLDADGTWLIVEPAASDSLEENFNPVGRIFVSASSFICVPASRDQQVGAAWVRRQARRASVRRSARAASPGSDRTPFNLVLEARP